MALKLITNVETKVTDEAEQMRKEYSIAYHNLMNTMKESITQHIQLANKSL